MPTKYRRGFKAEAERISIRLRAELGIQPHAPICPRVVAKQQGMLIMPLSQLRRELPQAVEQFTNKDPGAFSASTIVYGEKRLILYNDIHHKYRQNADIAHEAAHIILGHPPARMMDTSGCRQYDPKLEAEADWLGPTILISREAAMHILKRRIHLEQACEMYGVSLQLLKMRINTSGVKRQLAYRSK